MTSVNGLRVEAHEEHGDGEDGEHEELARR